MQWDSKCWDSNLLEVDSWFVFIMSFDWSSKTQTLPGFGEVLHWHIWRTGVGDEEPLGWRFCTERWLPTFFFEGLQKQQFLYIYLEDCQRPLKLTDVCRFSWSSGTYTDAFEEAGGTEEVSSQIPEVFLATEFRRWAFPKTFAGLGLEIPFQGIPSLAPDSWTTLRPRAELVRSYRHGRVRQDLGFEILGLKSLCLGITRNSIEMMELTGDGTNVVYFCWNLHCMLLNWDR